MTWRTGARPSGACSPRAWTGSASTAGTATTARRTASRIRTTARPRPSCATSSAPGRGTWRNEERAMSESRAIPNAGPDFEHLLAQDVVIAGNLAVPTGAQAIEPDHSPRAPQASAVRTIETALRMGLATGQDLQRE